MELKHLHTFRVLAKELSFSKAAETLNYAQSSVTAHIQALEDELGVPLFERLGKRVVLTAAGQRMVAAAQKMLSLADEIKSSVPGSEVPSGTLTIGAHESQCTYRLPPILREFRSRYPQVQLIFRPIISDRHSQELLIQGTLDAAFLLELAVKSDQLLVEPLVEERIVVLAHPQHRLARSKRVSPTDLDGEAIFTTEQGCSYRQLFEQSLLAARVQPGAKIEFAGIEGIKQCVMAGLGITVLPEMTVAQEIARGQLAPLAWAGPDFQVFTQVAWHKDKWISPALRAFLEITRNTLRPKDRPIAANERIS
jgi:DNA-binding transcriptional LysR family regulator